MEGIQIKGFKKKIVAEFGYGNDHMIIHFGEVDNATVKNAKKVLLEFLKSKEWAGIVGVVRTGTYLSFTLLKDQDSDEIVFNN